MHSVSLRVASLRAASRIRFTSKLLLSTEAAKAEPAVDSEYWDEPQYPPIVDISRAAVRLRNRENKHKNIALLSTVEEKQIALNMPKYYGFKCVRFFEDKIPYGALPVVQCYTRTHLVQKAGLPDVYTETEPAAALVTKEIKRDVEEALEMEYNAIKRTHEYSLEKLEVQQAEDATARVVSRQLNRIIVNALSDRLPHIFSAQVDYDPRHEAFWFVGGIDPTKSVQNLRKQKKWLEPTVYDPTDRPIHYSGTPLIALRCNLPLRPLVPYSECDNPSLEVPKYTYHPETAGYYGTYMHGTNIPGYWPGDQDEFGLLSIHGRGHLLTRKEWFGEKDNLEALDCQAMKSSFGWLLAQASYQGFTTFNDLTYPLVTQTAITNGQYWSLYAYQLNTVKMHNEMIDENPKRNICYSTGPLKLFEGFDDKGKVVGFNEDVLKQILQLYMNTPETRDYDMKPYLGESEQYVADIEFDQKRNWLENTYKHLVSNRERHLLPPEIYLWEKIYKIKFKTRTQDAKRRFFELGELPFNRRLDEHTPKYIPKALRSQPKSRRMWERTFYPKV